MGRVERVCGHPYKDRCKIPLMPLPHPKFCTTRQCVSSLFILGVWYGTLYSFEWVQNSRNTRWGWGTYAQSIGNVFCEESLIAKFLIFFFKLFFFLLFIIIFFVPRIESVSKLPAQIETIMCSLLIKKIKK